MQIDKNVLEIIEEKRLRWYGHLKRMPENRIPWKILNWTAEGRKGKGRPRECWMDGVRGNMERKGGSSSFGYYDALNISGH